CPCCCAADSASSSSCIQLLESSLGTSCGLLKTPPPGLRFRGDRGDDERVFRNGPVERSPRAATGSWSEFAEIDRPHKLALMRRREIRTKRFKLFDGCRDRQPLVARYTFTFRLRLRVIPNCVRHYNT